MSLSLTTLREANIARDAEWDPNDQLDISFRSLELAGEAGEVSNAVKKIIRENLGLPGSRVTSQDLAEEIADVMICADLLAMEAGIDLSEAIRSKFNKTSDKVGLKTRIA